MRKRILGFVAVLTVLTMILSACSKPATEEPKPADTGNQTQTQTPAPAKEGVFYGGWPYEVPPKTHFNVFATGNLSMPGSPFTDLMTPTLAGYYWSTNTWEPMLATDWTIDQANGLITVNLRKGIKWSDGSDFKAQDILTYMSIGKAKNYTIWRYVDKVTAKDDYTVEFHLPDPATIAVRYILRFAPQPTSVYGEWAKKFEELYAQGKDRTSDEVKALVKEFDDFRPEAYVASGPYVMDVKSITEAQMTLVKRDGGLASNVVKFDKIVIYNGETAAITPLVLDKKVDFATHAFPPATEKQMLNQGIRVVRYPFYNGPGIFFNYNNPLFNHVEFRQAMAYAINRDEAGTVALSKSGVGVKYMSGMSDNFVGTWMSPADAAKLNKYEYNPAKAEELLKSIGFKKGADSIWVDDKGKVVEFEFGVPSDFSDWSAAGENVVQQLNKFGFKVALRGTPWSQYSTDMADGNFQVGFLSWGSGIPHPQFTYTASLKNYNGGGLPDPVKDKPGMNWPLKQTWSGGEIDFDQALIDSGKGLDIEKQKQVIGKIALAFNELLPAIQVFERYSNSPVLENIHATGWPADNDPIMTNAGGDNFVTLYILTGKLAPAK